MIDFEVRREVASSQVMRIAARSAFLELVTAAAVAAVAAEVVSRSAARTPPSTRAGGQDDGSLNKLPQNKKKMREFVLTTVILAPGACGREGPSSS